MTDMTVGQLRESLKHLGDDAQIVINAKGEWFTLGRLVIGMNDQGIILFADPLSLEKLVDNPLYVDEH